jgi:hypothetical protein
MGCWNKTCGLSNLPIHAGEKAYVFVLEPELHQDSHCYATHLYRPCLLPFETEYNDYGGGVNSTGAGLNVVMESIKRELHEMEIGANQYHDIAVTKDNFGEELFFDAVHEGRLYKHNRYANDEDDHTKLEFVMFRKDIVDNILENHYMEKYVGDGAGTHGYGNNYIRYYFKDIVADILPMIQEIANKHAENSESMSFKIMGGFEYLFEYGHPNKAAQWLRGDSHRYSQLVRIEETLVALFESQGPTADRIIKFEEILTEYLKGMFIDAFMEMTRKSWIPAGHEGSQGDEQRPYRSLISATLAVMDRRKAQYEANTGEVYED